MKYLFATAKVILCLIATVSFITACTTTGGRFGIQWGDGAAGNHPVIINAEETGPPPHAPAHGYRAKHRYHYYPSCSVYYESESKLYFYLRGDDWQVSASLPNDLRVQLNDYVSIGLDTDRPYVYYEEHKTKYPPGQMKKKGNKREK